MERLKARKIPDDDDDEIQQVPPAAYVGAGVHDQTVGQNLGEGLDGEDDEEDVLNLFLWTKERARRGFMEKDRCTLTVFQHVCAQESHLEAG